MLFECSMLLQKTSCYALSGETTSDIVLHKTLNFVIVMLNLIMYSNV